jgi:hypothetical protein
MATNPNHTPVKLQARRLSDQKKANMRGRIELVAPRAGVNKRTYNTSSRNRVNKIKSDQKKIFFFILGFAYK